MWAQVGTVLDHLSMLSDILKGDRSFAVYLPPDYDTSQRSYPVLYLLHGGGDDHTGWVQFGEVLHIADKAIREGRATPMVIAMPDANSGRRGYFNHILPEGPRFRQRTRRALQFRSAASGGSETAIVNPAKLSREGQMDLSSLCHAGVGQALAPPLSFVAGDALEKFLKLASPSSGEHVDFHGSQTQTLMKSRVGRAVGRRICWRPGVRGCARNAGRRLAGRPRPFAAGCGIAGARVPTTPARLTGPRC